MHKCDFCRNDGNCRGAARSECIVRDFRNFRPEVDTQQESRRLERLLQEAGVANPSDTAQYLMSHGIGLRYDHGR